LKYQTTLIKADNLQICRQCSGGYSSEVLLIRVWCCHS